MMEYQNLSLHLTKEQLKTLVHELSRQHYLIFWGFNKGQMILHAYHPSASNQITFVRHKHTMELVSAKIVEEKVLACLNQTIQFSARARQNEFDHLLAAKEEQYKEIDYLLSKLYYYIQQGDEEKIAEIKAILTALSSDAS